MAVTLTIRYTDPLSDPLKKQPFTLVPGEVNKNSTSLALMGQGVADYTKLLNEDLIKLLEHSASGTAPANPTVGQIWFDSTTNLAKVYRKNGAAYQWSPLGGVIVSPTPPAEQGSLWYDTSNANPLLHQLKIYNAAVPGWLSVADRYVLKSGDTVTGHIRTATTNIGLANAAGTNFISPVTTKGVGAQSTTGAAVVLSSTSGATTGSEFAIGAYSTDFTLATDATRKVFSVKDTGDVTIHRGNLSVSNNKLLLLAQGTNPTDGINLQQLLDARAAIQILIDQANGEIAAINTALTGKVAKAGDTMSGALVINNTLRATGRTTLAGGVDVTGTVVATGAISSASLTTSGGVSVNGTLGVVGSATFNSGIQVGGQLTSLGAISGQTMSMAGAVNFASTLVVGNTVTMNSTLTTGDVILINRPMSSIINARHATTKEYVDSKIQAIPIPKATTGLWAGVTTLANIAATYNDINAYPPGTVIAFDSPYSSPYGYGNGTAYANYNARTCAIRTTNAGWVLGASNYATAGIGIVAN